MKRKCKSNASTSNFQYPTDENNSYTNNKIADDDFGINEKQFQMEK